MLHGFAVRPRQPAIMRAYLIEQATGLGLDYSNVYGCARTLENARRARKGRWATISTQISRGKEYGRGMVAMT